MKGLLILFSLGLFLCSCNSAQIKKVQLEDLNALTITPLKDTYKLTMDLEGNVECPIKLTLLRDSKHYQRHLLKGKIDTLFSSDWYGSELGFQVEPRHCASNVEVVVSLFHG